MCNQRVQRVDQLPLSGLRPLNAVGVAALAGAVSFRLDRVELLLQRLRRSASAFVSVGSGFV